MSSARPFRILCPATSTSVTLPLSVPGYTGEEPVRGRPVNADEGFFEVYELELLAGRLLNREFGQDNALMGIDIDEQDEPIHHSVVLSESAVRLLGIESPELALGMTVEIVPVPMLVPEIVGVVKDFHFTSLRQEILPTIFYMDSEGFGNLTVRFRSGTDVPALVSDITAIWKDFIPQDPITLEYLDQNIANLYENDRQQGMMVTALAQYSPFGCLPGFVRIICTLSSRDITRSEYPQGTWRIHTGYHFYVAVAVFDSGAYRDRYCLAAGLVWIEPVPGPVFIPYWTWASWYFAGVGLAALLIAGLTVGGHAYKVARSSPINALRERQ